MSVGSPFIALAGSPPARRLVNTAFHLHAKLRMKRLNGLDPLHEQERTIRRLCRAAGSTKFGRDHGLRDVRSVQDYQRRVPIRTYEDLWNDYLRAAFPVFEDLTWPGRTPYLALTSGTTQGATKYIPITQAMVRSNRKAAQTTTAAHMAARPDSRLFEGRIFFLGGTTQLEKPAVGVRIGDLSGVAAVELSPALRPYTFPPLDLALESDWDRKLDQTARRSVGERITLVSGVPSWLLMLFRRVLEISGRSTIAEVWPHLEMIVHGGVSFAPYAETFQRIVGSDRIRLQETYPCSEGFIAFGDHETNLLRLIVDHGIFYEFVPVEELRGGGTPKTRRWLGDVETGVEYAIIVTTCAGMWSHVIGDTIRFESLDPPLFRFTGRTRYSLSAFGEHLIYEEVEAAIVEAAKESAATVGEWNVGPVFTDSLGFHQYVIEFETVPSDASAYRRRLDSALMRLNDDYRAHRGPGSGVPEPALIIASPGSFEEWMRSRNRLGGQNKVPRMDGGGALTQSLVDFVRRTDRVVVDLGPGAPP